MPDPRQGSVPIEALVALYGAVGWTAYTAQPDRLEAAVRGSTWVQTLWEGEALIGLVRVVSDDASIAWLQDILVHPDHQRRGLGRQLMQAALDRFGHVTRICLMTDGTVAQRAFYTAFGFVDTDDLSVQLVTYLRQDGVGPG